MKTVKLCFVILGALMGAGVIHVASAQVYSGQKGVVKLRGEAPQETITAESSALAGKLDASTRRFNFKLNTFSFSQGDLQKKHAEESYFEVDKFPHATFTGEIINDVNVGKDGVYNVTVKGKFNLHGVEKELKLPAVITVENGLVTVSSKFSIFLSDFNIKIPRLVALKVSPEFTVDLTMSMNKM
jgi:polyisoprenoid-binding protein YceI